MAKSLRSRHKKHMRAIKRKKNEKRVLEMLHKTINNAKLIVTEDMVKLKELEELKKQRKEKREQELAEAEAKEKGLPMEVDSTTTRNKNWNFPSWATGRDIRRIRKQRKFLKRRKRKIKQLQKDITSS